VASSVTQRSTFTIAAAALQIGAVAIAFSVVAIARSKTNGNSSMQMSDMSGMDEHMAAAPMEGVPDATAAQGGRPLKPQLKNGVG